MAAAAAASPVSIIPSFWSSSARPTLTQVLCTKLFGPSQETLQNPPQHICQPTGAEELTLADLPQATAAQTDYELTEYVKFLADNFSAAPDHPQSSLTVKQTRLLQARGARHIIWWCGSTGKAVGCIGSLPLGRLRRAGSALTDYEVRLIRDFCVGPVHRRRGIGNGLLHAILADSRALGQVCAVFLKEGAPIGRAGPSLYSSMWMYRRYKGRESVFGVSDIPTQHVNEMLAAYAAETTRLIYNVPRDSAATSTRVFLYRGFSGGILVGFTPAYQRHPANGAEIIYQTGWLERGYIFPMERINAVRALSEYAARSMKAGWIWMDRAVFGKQSLPPKWKADGPFHWYAYNWTAGHYGNVPLFWRF